MNLEYKIINVIIATVVVVGVWSWNSTPLRGVMHMQAYRSESKIKMFNHSEYHFGTCNYKVMEHEATIRIDHEEVHHALSMNKYISFHRVPECVRVVMSGPERFIGLFTHLPFQLCFTMITFIFNQYLNDTIMMEITFFQEYEAPLDFQCFLYNRPIY